MTQLEDSHTSEAPQIIYPSKWETDTILSDGHTVAIRPIKPSDAPRIEALHSRLSPETIYFRFFTPLPRLSPPMLSRFVNVDYDDRMALVALLGDDIIAVARYDRLPGSSSAEVAFLVDDAHQGRGIATIMLEFLVESAREAGISTFIADTLPENMRMLRVFRDAGFEDSRSFQDGVIRVRFDINPTIESINRMHAREQRAVARSMRRILAPKSIAVVGASRDPQSVGNVIFRNLLESSFAGPVYPVNSHTNYVSAVRSYKSITEIDDEIDLAIVAIPAPDIKSFISEAAEMGVGGIVIISSGFSDASNPGAYHEREIVRLARRNGMRVVGPSSMGVANTHPLVSMNATVAPFGISQGKAALVAHSGALGLAIVEEARRRGLGLSSFVSTGNRADVSANDLLQYWENDDTTDVVLLYLETFGNPRSFARIARKVAATKPIVAVKARRYGHTGAMVARSLPKVDEIEVELPSPKGRHPQIVEDEIAVDALLEHTGVIRVDSLEQLFEVGRGLVSQPLPKGRSVAILSNSGGPAPLAQDACVANGLRMAKLSPETQALIEERSSTSRLSNPIEFGAEVPPEVYGEALEILLKDEAVDAVIVVYVPTVTQRYSEEQSRNRPEEDPPAIAVAKAVARSIATTAAKFVGEDKKTVLANFLAIPGLKFELTSNGAEIPNYNFPEMSATVLARMAEHYEWKNDLKTKAITVTDVDNERANRLVRGALEALAAPPEGSVKATWLSASDTTALLNSYKIETRAHEETTGYLSYELAVPFDLKVVHDRLFGPVMSMAVQGEITAYLDSSNHITLPFYEGEVEKFIDDIPAIGLIMGDFERTIHDVPSLVNLLARVSQLIEDNFEIVNLCATVISTPNGSYLSECEILLNDWSPMASAITRSLR